MVTANLMAESLIQTNNGITVNGDVGAKIQ